MAKKSPGTKNSPDAARAVSLSSGERAGVRASVDHLKTKIPKVTLALTMKEILDEQIAKKSV